MSNIFEAFSKVAEKNAWKYIDFDGVYKIDVTGSNGSWPSFVKIIEQEGIFLYYSLCTSKIKSEKFHDVMKFITMINYGLKLGNFEFSIETGELHFKTYVKFSEDNVYEDLIEQCIITNILSMDSYLPSLMKIIHSDENVEKIVEKAD